MSGGKNGVGLLSDVDQLGKKCSWVDAVALHTQALRAMEDGAFLKRGKTHEKIGFCLRRAAMQADSQAEFSKRMQRAARAD